MKKLLFVLLILFMLTACGGKEEPVVQVDKKETVVKEQEKKAKEDVKKVEEEKKAKETKHIIKVDEKLLFGELTVNFKQVEIKDDKAIVTFSWINQAGDGEKFFFALAGIDVMQNDLILEEVSGAYDIKNKNSSDVFFPNAEGGEKEVMLEYELKDKETSLEIGFTPYNGIEDTQGINVDIN
ncbi:DUF5067 domain-containing protein [Sutcliffiella cohnii]